MQPVRTNSTDKTLSYSLDLLRFPMITIIVLIHTNFAVQPAQNSRQSRIHAVQDFAFERILHFRIALDCTIATYEDITKDLAFEQRYRSIGLLCRNLDFGNCDSVACLHLMPKSFSAFHSSYLRGKIKNIRGVSCHCFAKPVSSETKYCCSSDSFLSKQRREFNISGL